MKININMVRQASNYTYCARQSVNFIKIHKLDLDAFLNEGIDEELIIATGDAVAARIVEEVKVWVRKRK